MRKIDDSGPTNGPQPGPTLSIVIPVYNESEVIKETLQATERNLKQISENYEIIIIDDGSTDRTWECLESATDRDLRIKLIRFTRNFGKESAILAGLRHSSGAGVVVMDADMQHPPELLIEMVRLWREDGYDVVHGVKEERQDEPFLSGFFAKMFYGMMAVFSGYDLRGATDYKLMDRSVADRYVGLPENVRFFRGLIPWLGFKNASVFFSPEKRKKGRSRWSSLALFRFAVRAITSFSSLPMQVVTIMGGVMFITSIVLGFQTLFMTFTGRSEEGFPTVILLLLFVGSVLMVSLGVIGQYIALIYEEVKRRPPFVIEKTRNI